MLCLICAAQVKAGEPLNTVTLNQIGEDDEGWLYPTSGDPYLVFDARSVEISEANYLKIQTRTKHVLNRHLYMELFYATESHGFSEKKKGFYIQPLSVSDTVQNTVYLNLGEFLQVMEESGEHISVLRLDIDPRGLTKDFRFQCTMRVLKTLPDETDHVTIIHPPYLSRHVMTGNVFAYASKHAFREFFHKLMRDPLFIVLYALALGLPLMLLVYTVRRKPNA